MTIYVLKDGVTGKTIEAFDTQASAQTQADNLLKTGQYRRITIELVNVSSATIAPFSVVHIAGKMTASGPKFTVDAYDPQATIPDSLTFNVSSRDITFDGYVNLTSAEVAATDINALTTRIAAYVETELATRIMNDN